MLDEQMTRIRTEMGATYGVDVRRDAGISAWAYRIESAIDAPRAGEALRAMRAGIDALRSSSDFDALFVRARRKVAQELLNGSTVSLIARELDPRSEVIVVLGDRAAVTRAYAEAGIDDARFVVPTPGR